MIRRREGPACKNPEPDNPTESAPAITMKYPQQIPGRGLRKVEPVESQESPVSKWESPA